MTSERTEDIYDTPNISWLLCLFAIINDDGRKYVVAIMF